MNGHRTFGLRQRIRYGYSAPVTNLSQRLMTVPRLVHGGQRRQRWNLTIDGVESYQTRASVDAFGNLVVEATVPRVDRAVEFVVDVEVMVEVSDVGVAHPLLSDARYLRPTRLTAADPVIADLADVARGGDVGRLCARVHQALDYEWGITGVGTTASEALAGGRGVCQDFAHIMIAACRCAGLPARYVSGHLPGDGGSHAWVEVLHPARDRPGIWIAEGWDPSRGRQVDPDYLVVSFGRDYADVAPLSGIYSGMGATGTLTVEKQLSVA